MRDTVIDNRSADDGNHNGGSDVDMSALLRTLIGIVRQNLLLIFGIVFSVVICGVAATLLMTPRYDAVSQIVIEDRADQIIEGGDLQQAVSASETARFLQTQLGIIRSRALALFIVQGGKLDRDPSFFAALGSEMPSEAPPGKKLDGFRRDMAVNLLLEALDVSIPQDSRIASLRVTSRSAQLSAKLANLYAERFIDYNLNQKYESSGYARQFLAVQLDEARTKLTQSERDLNRYARAAGLIRVTSQGASGTQDATLSVTNSQLVDLNAAAAAATAQRIAAEDRWKTVANQPALSISEVTSNTAVMQLVAQRTGVQAELAQELSRHRDGFATVQAKRAELAELDQRINAITASVKRSAFTDYHAAIERENSLKAKVVELRTAALKEQDQGVQYSVLKRVADTNRALYESLLSRFNQLNASAGSASNNVAIVDRAIVPTSPSSPNLLLNIFLSLTLGVLFAAVAVAIKHLLDDRIGSPAEVEKKLGLSLLGLIPYFQGDNISDELTNSRSGLNEAYRSLVTNLTYTTTKGFPPVLAVTSSRAGEGKSTTSQAVAMDLARLGKRTLLVDADLRRPTLHRYLDDKEAPGLTDILIGQKTFDQVVTASPTLPTLSYVTALPIPPDPGLLLAGDGLQKFLTEARSQFDVVIVDCPPLLGLSDVPLIVRHADGVLFVIDGTKFNNGVINAALDRLRFVRANILGVALSRFRAKSGTSDYSYYGNNYYSYAAERE